MSKAIGSLSLFWGGMPVFATLQRASANKACLKTSVSLLRFSDSFCPKVFKHKFKIATKCVYLFICKPC